MTSFADDVPQNGNAVFRRHTTHHSDDEETTGEASHGEQIPVRHVDHLPDRL